MFLSFTNRNTISMNLLEKLRGTDQCHLNKVCLLLSLEALPCLFLLLGVVVGEVGCLEAVYNSIKVVLMIVFEGFSFE